jgi:hypothetical protein
MNRELKTKWIKALRSGKFLQGRKRLRVKEIAEDKTVERFCCLGVLCEVAGLARSHSGYLDAEDADYGSASYPPERFPNGLSPPDWHIQAQLAAMNDGDELTFAEIADWIEENVPTE